MKLFILYHGIVAAVFVALLYFVYLAQIKAPDSLPILRSIVYTSVVLVLISFFLAAWRALHPSV